MVLFARSDDQQVEGTSGSGGQVEGTSGSGGQVKCQGRIMALAQQLHMLEGGLHCDVTFRVGLQEEEAQVRTRLA